MSAEHETPPIINVLLGTASLLVFEEFVNAIHSQPRSFFMNHSVTVGTKHSNVFYFGFVFRSHFADCNCMVSFYEVFTNVAVSFLKVKTTNLAK